MAANPPFTTSNQFSKDKGVEGRIVRSDGASALQNLSNHPLLTPPVFPWKSRYPRPR